jgi:hypothetical protein
VDFVEERRDALIEHDDAGGRQAPELQCEQGGVGEKRLMPALVEEVDDVRIGEGLTRPGALADPTHAVEEEAALWPGENAAVLTR